MPAISWADLDTNINPVPIWRFYCTLPSITGSNGLNGQTLSFLVERVTLPIPGIAFEPVPYNAGERKYPATRTLDVIGITFVEDQNYSVLTYFKAWKDLVVDDSGNFGLPSTYKKQLQLDSLNEQGEVIHSFTYPYCAPTRVDSLEFDGTVSRFLPVTIYFEVDNVFNNGGGGTGTGTGGSANGAISAGTGNTAPATNGGIGDVSSNPGLSGASISEDNSFTP